jgi:N-acetylglucosaminyl-diphospho-decaprenol L-rhamnosyltransferase
MSLTAVRKEHANGSALSSAIAVLLNWNQTDVTLRSVRSLIGDGFPPDRIVVVDNASELDAWHQLRDALPECFLVRLDRNIGFARGANIGAGVLSGDYLFLINNDAFVHRPGSLDRLVRALHRDGIGIAVPRVLNEDLSLQPNVVPFLSPLVALLRASGLSRFVPNRLQPRWATHWDHSESRPIDAANGAVMVLRGEVWEKLGGLTERAFMYAEDIDLFWRVRALGWGAWFEADAEFIHLGNTTSGTQWSLAQRAEVVGSAERAMLEDYLPPASWRFVIATTRFGHLLRVVVHRLRGDVRAAAIAEGSVRGLGGHANPQLVPTAEKPGIEIIPPRT